ncbi:Zeaxanthin epoxidase [Escovopsis weberi]|uniref:Zeaxanthin epoxidase n=1 Tax=Escovopsis weberi TaxID=150374 RepID=A0A0M8N4R4_ESCWE|nr:Zeaxanthin epoxidase [Escovopsis weberi]
MKIAIIGAGVAGCAAYLELRKHLPKPTTSTDKDKEPEHDIKIYEAYSTEIDESPETRDGGSIHSTTLLVGGGLAIGSNGLGVLQRLDETLLREVTHEGHVASHYNIRDKNGRVLIRVAPMEGENPSPLLILGTTRHSLWKNLRSLIPSRDIIQTRVAEVIPHADGRNTVMFRDGRRPEEVDLVVGADGIWSTTKRALFSDAEQSQHAVQFSGLVGVGGFVPAADVKDLVEPGSINFVFGDNGFFGYYYNTGAESDPHAGSPYHVSEPGDSLGWWSTYALEDCPDRASLDMEPVLKQLLERHGNWQDPVIQRIIHTVKFKTIWPTWTTPPLPTWERDGVVLIGDAAHALPPSSGQGSSQALEDSEAFALFLGHHLRKEGALLSVKSQKEAINAAARQFFALRQPRLKEILSSSQALQNKKRNMSVFQKHLMYAFMSIRAGGARKVHCYNISEQVARILASES